MSHHHHPLQITPSSETLYVIAVISNPERYNSRYRLAREFIARMEATPNVQLILVEHAFGNRVHELTDPKNVWHLQLRGKDNQELWIKEAMINAGVRYLTRIVPDWNKMLFVDADVEFTRPNWVQETLAEMDHSRVIQPWSDAIDLGPNHETFAHHKSMLYCYRQGIKSVTKGTPSEYGAYWHSGFAWGMRRDAWDALGGLLDWCIMGSGDHHMAWAMLGQVECTVPGAISDGYKKLLYAWQERAVRAIGGQIGYVRGTILHHWHGRKRDRRYQERWQYLLDAQFDPITDIIYDDQGIPKLVGNKPKLRDDLRGYLRARNEDSVDLD